MRGIQVSEYVKVPLYQLPSAIQRPSVPSPRHFTDAPPFPQGPRELRVTTLPDPVPSPDDYVISVRAAAANFFDILQVQGKYQSQPPFPWVSGAEFAGVVVSVPSRLGKRAKFPVGSRVFGAGQGAFATLVPAREIGLQAVPDGWSFEDAAGLSVTVSTSYGALVVRAGIKSGDWVLVHAAAGGVGLAAVQSKSGVVI